MNNLIEYEKLESLRNRDRKFDTKHRMNLFVKLELAECTNSPRLCESIGWNDLRSVEADSAISSSSRSSSDL